MLHIAPLPPGVPDDLFAPPVRDLVAGLARAFGPRVEDLLRRRREAQAARDAGEPLDFLAETREIRESPWQAGPVPRDLQDRKVEITGPAEPKMVINALNSGASVFMADFEDSLTPTWPNVVRGQQAVREAVAGTLAWDDPATGKAYRLRERRAVLMIRPRGWHLPERHVTVDGRPVPGALVDFGVWFAHNALALVRAGSGPYLYLPKLESHLEARLWNDVFVHAQDALGLPRGTVRATVLIETLPAAFRMDEILWELRDHAAGLNCGRWDYIFSSIKARRADPAAVMPDRAQVTMEQPSMRAYARLLVRTCHRRGVHGMGGMAAQIPIKDDPQANRAALERVRADKVREAGDGHDGTWVAHPGLVALAREVFDAHVPGPHQIARSLADVRVAAADLLEIPRGTRTEDGLRLNVRVGILYLEAWLRGQGCVPLFHLMEDAATAEISRTQVWQWVRHRARLADGRTVTPDLVRAVVADETGGLTGGRHAQARALFTDLALAPDLADFLTLPAYDALADAPVPAPAAPDRG